MATISKNWQSQVWIEGGSGSWTTLSGTTEEFSSSVDLVTNGYAGAHVMVEVDYDSTPTDQVEIRLYGSLDGSNWDDTAFMAILGDHDQDPQQISFILRDMAYFRIGFQQTGSTDSHNVRASHRIWNWTDA